MKIKPPAGKSGQGWTLPPRSAANTGGVAVGERREAHLDIFFNNDNDAFAPKNARVLRRLLTGYVLGAAKRKRGAAAEAFRENL
jgi:hypothetical protein